MKYHLRDTLGTVQLNPLGQEYSITGFEVALCVAYKVSGEKNQTIYVCRGSSDIGMPSYTEVAAVKCLP